MGLDLKSDYKQLKDKISATQSYNELKREYNSVTKSVGESFDDLKESTSDKLSELKGKVKKFEKDTQGQLDRLLDVATISSNGNTGTISFIKKLLLKVIKKIEPILSEILFDETIKAIGCDQQQRYQPGQVLYIKVSALDLLGLLKIDPNDGIGKFLYETNPISIQDNPFSMNRQLYELTQTNISYSGLTGQLYKGQSGQDLFDIEYTETNNLNQPGPWFKITLAPRFNNATTVVQFLLDYYKSIRVVEFNNIIANVMNILTGALDIGLNTGTNQLEVNSKFQVLLLRILGICFDNRKEIDVSGVAKIPQDDPIDDSFFEFSAIDLRNIEIRISNIKKGVVQYVDCGNVELPVDVDSIVGALDALRFVPDEDQVNAASQITQSLTNNPNWNINIPGGNITAAVDANFIKLMGQAVVVSLLSPKVLLPFYTMLLSLGQQDINLSENLIEFTKKFKKFMINLISRVGAQFIEKLYNQIKKDLLKLIDSTIQDIEDEKKRKTNVIILKLIQILLLVGQLITDWRKCKSIVDELLKIVSLSLQFPGVARGLSSAAKAVTKGIETASDATTNFIDGIGGKEGNRDGGTFGGGGNDDDEEDSNGSSGGVLGSLGALLNQIPLPLLFASEFLDGYSESRAFINAIEEMQKLGIPTGPMPDGSPNLTVLSMFGNIKAVEKEKIENGKVSIAIKPTTVTPAGVTIPNIAFGKNL
jgi:hypothetical protein